MQPKDEAPARYQAARSADHGRSKNHLPKASPVALTTNEDNVFTISKTPLCADIII